MIALLLMLAQIAPGPNEPKPVVATIAAIRANPKKFDGQIVRLHGYVTRCSASDCAVSERPATAPGGLGDVLSIATNPQFDATVGPLVPTYVEFDARLDAACLINICIGRAPVLNVVTLRGVVSPEPPPIEN
jgi:hypothetical protein